MSRRPVAIVLLAVASLSFIRFMVRVTTAPLTDVDLWLNFIATSTGVWGVVLLLRHDRIPPWAVTLLGGMTVAGLAITIVLLSNLPG
jgi:hypothetical protein